MQVKKRFEPHTLWEGDGKQLTITINGEIFQFCWYAFIDQTTTLLVGSSITDNESSASFLESLKDGKNKVGFYAVGVLLDNRLPETDLSAVKEFCNEHSITIIRTFPGNSKSNGNIENNFSIFEKFVGEIHIQGANDKEIARSVANAIIEVFTQQRNYSPRKRFGGKTPAEESEGSNRPVEMREAVERMKSRFEKEADDVDKKFELIKTLIPTTLLSNESIEKIKSELKKFTPVMIVAARASFEAQAAKYPENVYSIEYFWAILRYKQEEIAKQTYNESFRAGINLANNLFPAGELSLEKLPGQIHDVIREIFNTPTSARHLLQLESLSWWLVSLSERLSLSELWQKVEKYIERSIYITARTWANVVEFINSRVGHLIYEEIKITTREVPLGNYSSVIQ